MFSLFYFFTILVCLKLCKCYNLMQGNIVSFFMILVHLKLCKCYNLMQGKLYKFQLLAKQTLTYVYQKELESFKEFWSSFKVFHFQQSSKINIPT